MSAEEEKAAKNKILIEYCDAATVLAIRMEESARLGKELVGLGQMLQSEDQASNIAIECYQELLSKKTYDEVAKLQQVLPAAQAEAARLADRMRQIGYGHMLGSKDR